MKQVKVLLISFFFLAVVLFLFSLLIPSRSVVSRSIDIKSSRQALRNNIEDLQRWNNWNTAIKSANGPNQPLIVDTVKKQLLLKTAVINVLKESDSVFNISIVDKNGESMQSKLQFYYGDSVHTVNWKYYFNTSWYPWEKFRSMFYDKMFGAVLDSNLTALKKLTEANQ
jgi:hypothetical protein